MEQQSSDAVNDVKSDGETNAGEGSKDTTTITTGNKHQTTAKGKQRNKKSKKPQTSSPSSNQQQSPGTNKPPGSRLRGLRKDSEDIRLSKTISWLLRHGAQSAGLPIREDGFSRIDDLLYLPHFREFDLDLEKLRAIVDADEKQRFSLRFEGDGSSGAWWIKAAQGHTIETVKLEMKPILSVSDIPSGIAVHGTTRDAWRKIQTQGLSRMARNHIHLAQGYGGDNVISGMRKSSQIFIFVNVQKALDAGYLFFLSENGVVLTEGDASGFLKPEYFERVETVNREVLGGWQKDAKA